ncbi:BafA family autotransporter [Bartonella koehlerae]|uniref:Outer membrane autotransporter barrel domain-containing protein n=1 Tax=Bartonella koehlerae C-29 TaxID=1134510 RepID=A0A067WHY0_9HYPH|nr:BafA family autotransporter [Bartonella koehlerae]KEC55492.1 outer membrane autotransporter barrel domain-containing protein [Bartonella koehlerae C-29]
MRHKYKLSFSILIFSSYFTQVTSAGESKNEALTRVESVGNGKELAKGSALITRSPVSSNNIKISDGSVEIVENGGYSIGATIQKGGKQVITRQGIAIDTKIFGGKQFVFEESSANLEDLQRQSSAYNVTVSGEDGGLVGQQNVYDGATAWETKVIRNGEQNLYRGHREEGGIAQGTIVSGNGRQHVLAEGIATNTTLNQSATQVVYPDGIVDGLTINDSASSWLYVGADLNGEIKINDGGHLYLFVGDITDHITKEKLSVTERNGEVLFSVGTRSNKDKPQIYIENLSGNGGTVGFASIPYDPRHVLLNVEYLSGSLTFHLNISHAEMHSDYLFIENGTGNHKINISDSGREITGSFSRNNDTLAELNLISDRSQGKGASFTLVNQSGEEIEAIDGGTYMYRLHRRERNADFNGDFITWYLGRETGRPSSSVISSPRVHKRAKTRVPLVASSTDVGMQSHQKPSSSQRQGSNSQTTRRKNNEQTFKQRPPRHLRDAQHFPVLPTASFLESPVSDRLRPTGHYHPFDEQQQSVVSTDDQSLADQMIVRPSQQDRPSLQSSQKLPVFNFLTTPSTDAVLSMSVTPALVFHSEMQTVRAGRRIVDRSKQHASFWTYAIKSKENIVVDHRDFKLDQTGIVLGISGVSELMDGEFYIGSFGSYDQARVAHARGGVSNLNIYSIGAYATYFDHNGWYLDGVLKYNQYQNNLKAVSTNGIAIEGNYGQWGVGMSFEAGYRYKTTKSGWMQPYAQFSWLQVKGKEIKLSNEMMGDINRFTSLRSEFGLSAGYEFCLGEDVFSMAYITAAWLRENRDNNHTTINKLHQFVTDLSGNFGKLGIGLSSLVSEKFKLYAEAQYVKGDKMKQSFQGILGVRYSF